MSEWQHWLRTQTRAEAPSTSPSDAPTITGFGDMEAEYRALADGPAVVDRSYRGLLEITGADRASWLHNLTTNQIKPLSAGDGNYAFACNVQGRILFDLNILVRHDAIWVDLDTRFLRTAKAHFDKYTVTEDVSVRDLSDEFVRLGVVGRRAADWLIASGVSQGKAMPLLATAEVQRNKLTMSLLRTDFCGPLAFELLVPTERAVEVWQQLVDPSGAMPALPVGDEAVQARRIEAGIAWPGAEINDEVLPAETGQLERAVSFNKGCYLGQEIVERMRSRKVLARRLVGLVIEGDTPTPAGAAITQEAGEVVGKVTSVCRSPAKSCLLALGYVKTACCEPNTSLRVRWDEQTAAAAVCELPVAAPAAD